MQERDDVVLLSHYHPFLFHPRVGVLRFQSLYCTDNIRQNVDRYPRGIRVVAAFAFYELLLIDLAMEPSSNIKKERPHEGVTRTHIVDEPPAFTSHGRHRIDLTALINFTSNETSKLSYPIGCPVWYNFENSDSNHLNFCHGHVKGAAMDCNTRKFVYKIQKADSASVGHDGCNHRGPFDFVIEDDVTYAMSCPVRVSAECGKEFDGEIICSSPIRNERGHSINHVYSILLFIEENKMKVQHGIKSNQVKYRPKVAKHHMIESTASPVHISSELSVEKVTLSKLSHGSNQDTLDQGRLKWTPPSPIKRKALCINNAKWQMNYTSEHVDTPKKIPRKEPELSLHLTVPSWVLKAGENLLGENCLSARSIFSFLQDTNSCHVLCVYVTQ